MNNVFLGIGIPTRNRPNYLYDLLKSIDIQWEDKFKDIIKIFVFDNSSNDETNKIIENKFKFEIEYYKQPQYLNGDLSIRYAYKNTIGKYIFVCGDDEIIPIKSINIILELLKKYNPGLLLLKDNSYNKPSGTKEYYNNYIDFYKHCMTFNPHILIAHSLISANIVKKEIIDFELMDIEPYYCYSNFKGLINGVINSGEKVVCAQEPTIIVREQRAPPVDGLWPENIIVEQNKYLQWVYEKLKFL